jgi:predicted transcriptional regulator
MKAKELINLNANVKEMISNYIEKKQITLTEFARVAKIHQSHLWTFMNTDDPKKGMHSSTLEKIGVVLCENKK